MDLLFKNKKITGILSIVPQKVVSFEEEMANYNFSPAKSKKLALVMGYKQHRIALDHQTSADFCMHGLQYLFDNNFLNMPSPGKRPESDASPPASRSPP